MKRSLLFLPVLIAFQLTAQDPKPRDLVSCNANPSSAIVQQSTEMQSSQVRHLTVLQKNDKAELSWIVAANEEARIFEIQRSRNGIDFRVVGIMLASERSGPELYSFRDALKNSDAYYRIRMVDAKQGVTCSEVKQINSTLYSDMQLAVNEQ